MRAVQGVRGILRATGKQAERQEVAWACARALRPRACVLLSEEEDDRDGCGGGLAATVEGQVSGLPGERQVVLLSLSLLFSFFYFSADVWLY